MAKSGLTVALETLQMQLFPASSSLGTPTRPPPNNDNQYHVHHYETKTYSEEADVPRLGLIYLTFSNKDSFLGLMS